MATTRATPQFPYQLLTCLSFPSTGLEAQLLGIVVRKERQELEEQKDSLVLNIAAGKAKLEELEGTILRLLNEAQGSLLEDEQLVNALQGKLLLHGCILAASQWAPK